MVVVKFKKGPVCKTPGTQQALYKVVVIVKTRWPGSWVVERGAGKFLEAALALPCTLKKVHSPALGLNFFFCEREQVGRVLSKSRSS